MNPNTEYMKVLADGTRVAAENLWLAIEQAVERFPARRHRYGIGARLNTMASIPYRVDQ